MADVTLQWVYDLHGVTLDASTDRYNTPSGRFPEVYGIDGRFRDGARPFPGFVLHRELNVSDFTPPSGYTRADLKVAEATPILVKVGRTDFVDAWVIRLTYPDGTSQIRLYWRPPQSTTTHAATLWDSLSPETRRDGLKRGSVTVAGRTGYVFVQGALPLSFWWQSAAARPEDLKVSSRTGSGPGMGALVFTTPIASRDTNVTSSTGSYLRSGTNSYGNMTGASDPGENFLNLLPPQDNEVQEIRRLTPISSGSWRVRVTNPNTLATALTTTMANPTAASLQSALNTAFNAAGVSGTPASVTGGGAATEPVTWRVEFTGTLAATDIPTLIIEENTGTYTSGSSSLPVTFEVVTTDHVGSGRASIRPFSFFHESPSPAHGKPDNVTNPLYGPTNFQTTGPGLYQTISGVGGPMPLKNPTFVTFAVRRRVSGSTLTGIDDVTFDSRKHSILPGALDGTRKYGYVFQLWDQFRSGRVSKVSPTVVFTPHITGQEPFRSPSMETRAIRGTPSGGGSETTSYYLVASGFRCCFPGVEVVWNTNLYDTLLVWRTVADMPQGPLSLDGIYRLDRFATTNQRQSSGVDLPTPWRRAFIIHLADDDLIASSSPFDPSYLSLEEEMPRGGAGLFHEGVLWVADVQSVVSLREPTGSSVIRWSLTSRVSPENFSSLAFYPLARPGDEVTRLVPLGPAVVGLARENIYLLRREGTAVRAYHIVTGAGAANRFAATIIGGQAWIVSNNGLFILSEDGTAQSLPDVDMVIRQRWLPQLKVVSIAYCQETRAIYILNPTLREGYVYFLETGRSCLLADMVFTHVVNGPIAWSPGTTAGDVRNAAVFVQVVSPTTSTAYVRLYRTDTEDEKVITMPSSSDHGKKALCLLDPTGVLGYVVLAQNFTTGDTIYVERTSFHTTFSRLEGAALYVGSASFSALEARKAIIKSVTDPGAPNPIQIVIEVPISGVSPLHGLETGDVLFLTPVFMQVTGWALGAPQRGANIEPSPDTANILRDNTRLIATIRPTFRDVTGPPTLFNPSVSDYIPVASFFGTVHEGTTLVALGRPRHPDDSTDYVSLRNGPAPIGAPLRRPYGVAGNPLYPGVRVFTTHARFQMTSITIEGRILDTKRIPSPTVLTPGG